MIATFAGINCPNQKPVHKVCLTSACKVSPFLCLQSAICRCEDKHTNACTIKSIEELDQNIKTILKFEFFIVYSPQYKGNSIHVAGRYAVQTRPPLTNQRFVLTYDPIPLMASETVSFRLTKVRGCVGVGVFVRQILQTNQYRYIPDGSYLNHGCFMLLSNGLLYSSSNAQENGKTVKKFEVKQNDILKVKYDNQKVTFTSRLLEQSLRVECKIDEHIHFGVYLYDVQDQVEIVNTFVCGE